MRITVILILIATSLGAQNAFLNQYKSFSLYGEATISSNYKYISSPQKMFYGGGLDYTFSVKQAVNAIIGLNYLSSDMKFSKEKFKVCEYGNSCWIDSRAQYISIPLGAEFYQNYGKAKTLAYYRIMLMPLFSFKEHYEKTEFFGVGDVNVSEKSYDDNKFKFQDLHIAFAIGTEFSLSEKLKLFIEPNVTHSALFKKEDFINPNYIIGLKIGARIRTKQK